MLPPPSLPNCKPNTEQQKSGKENKRRMKWLRVEVCVGGGPAGEGSARLCLPGLQLGVPLTPVPHLHVQKSPVLKCCGVPPRLQRVWSTSLPFVLSACESSSSAAAASLSTAVLIRLVIPAFSRLQVYFQEISLCREGFENGTRVTVVCHGFCPQCLSFYFHTMIIFGWSRI